MRLLAHTQTFYPYSRPHPGPFITPRIPQRLRLTLLLPQGDLIPWTVSQQFQDPDFPALSGGRLVRVAVHPELGRAGYGSRWDGGRYTKRTGNNATGPGGPGGI